MRGLLLIAILMTVIVTGILMLKKLNKISDCLDDGIVTEAQIHCIRGN